MPLNQSSCAADSRAPRAGRPGTLRERFALAVGEARRAGRAARVWFAQDSINSMRSPFCASVSVTGRLVPTASNASTIGPADSRRQTFIDQRGTRLPRQHDGLICVPDTQLSRPKSDRLTLGGGSVLIAYVASACVVRTGEALKLRRKGGKRVKISRRKVIASMLAGPALGDAGGGPGSNHGCAGHQPPPPPSGGCGN
jgi:hypothetical protein